jgi:hypothetical protein
MNHPSNGSRKLDPEHERSLNKTQFASALTTA